MKTASKILEAKGFDNSQQTEIVYEQLDALVRDRFCVEGHAIHLWETYVVGDANAEELDAIAAQQGCKDHAELLKEMDYYLLELAEQY